VRVFRRTVLLGLLASALIPASAHGAVVATHIGDFDHPTYIAAPPGDTHRVMVVEQSGVIRLIKDGVIQSTAFLDASGQVTNGWVSHPSDPEQGMLSMAFAPDYATSHRFYVFYTTKTCPSAPGCTNVVATYTSDAGGDTTSDGGTVLLTIPHPTDVNHDGGQLQFGPDGDLYISTGDGGGSNDTHENAQNTSDLLGKVLRISPNASGYTIPAGNPFTTSECATGSSGSAAPCPEIWSYGLRNPWRFSFDSATGDLIIGDVGEHHTEEIDYAPQPNLNKGVNYGWPCYEGTDINTASPAGECATLPSPVTFPVLEYHHSCTGASFCGEGVIGGYVLHDPSLPSLNGCYIYGDLSTTRLRFARVSAGGAEGDADLGPHVSNLSAFGQDASGHIWAADVSGPVYRLDSDGNAATTPSCPAASAGPPPPVTNTGDTTPPVLGISFSKRQRVRKTHYIKITVVPNEVAVVTARATVGIPNAARVLRLHGTTRQTLGDKRITLHMRISKKTLARISRALRHHRSLPARVTVTARDASGHKMKARHLTIRIVR
jgi:glucose/arabinose dehydrogenase